jgi:hypothetical protein
VLASEARGAVATLDRNLLKNDGGHDVTEFFDITSIGCEDLL